MALNEIRDQIRIREWVELIKERNASGMTIKEWCAFKGLTENQYFYWLRKVRQKACEAIEDHADMIRPLRNEEPVFVEINVLPEPTSPERLSGILIHVNGAQIHIGNDVGIKRIRTIMEVIAHAE